MQVDPIKSMLKAPGTKRLTTQHDKLLSSSAFKFNLRGYTKGEVLIGFDIDACAVGFDGASVFALPRHGAIEN